MEYWVLMVSTVTTLITFVLANFNEVMLVVIALLLCYFAWFAFRVCIMLFEALGQIQGAIQVLEENTWAMKALLSEQNELLRPKIEVVTRAHRAAH